MARGRQVQIDMKFFNLPLEEALDEKWTRGKESIRVNGEGWIGDPPMEEAYEEVLDLINYIREAKRQGHLKDYAAYYLERESKNLLRSVRQYIQDKIGNL